MNFDQQYKEALDVVMTHGERKSNRTGIDTRSVFGHTFRHNLMTGFPLLQLRRMNFRIIADELSWMINGGTNIATLNSNIWNNWAGVMAGRYPDEYAFGELGRVYGAQWRSFGSECGVDQLRLLLETILLHPESRRLIISAWSPNELEHMALPPCHVLFQFNCNQVTRKMDLCVHQRSMDLPVGGPHDIAQFALFLHLVALVCNYTARDLVVNVADLHIYENQVEGVKELADRECGLAPTLNFFPEILQDFIGTDKTELALRRLMNFKPHHAEISLYRPHPAVKFEVAV